MKPSLIIHCPACHSVCKAHYTNVYDRDTYYTCFHLNDGNHAFVIFDEDSYTFTIRENNTDFMLRRYKEEYQLYCSSAGTYQDNFQSTMPPFEYHQANKVLTRLIKLGIFL